MCGIFGLQLKQKNKELLKNFTSFMLKESELRGRDASGIYLQSENIQSTLKKPVNGFQLTKLVDYSSFFENIKDDTSNIFNLIGQCRLATNGKIFINDFNQPIETENLTMLHNGIILNDLDLLNKFNITNKKEVSDSHNFAFFLDSLKKKNLSYNKIFEEIVKDIKGSYSIAFIDKNSEKIFFISNFGSLYFYKNDDFIIFSSEKKILENFILKKLKINQVNQILKTEINKLYQFSLQTNNQSQKLQNSNKPISIGVINNLDCKIKNLKRCSKCILPESYPYISFDKNGVCNYCNSYSPRKLKDDLKNIFDKYRSKDGSIDCLVGLSGGRDSCYGLHLLKKKYRMNPVAYTYDWGLTTDISRRNQALMVGALGVEHIIRAPNIDFKRDCIQKNINAWLKKPKLGMVPIFMSGDKDFYEYGRKLRKELGVKLTVFCSGHEEEQRNFFVGFCGVKKDLAYTSRLYEYPIIVKAQLAIYYMINFIINPRYINKSFMDSLKSFFTSFIFKDDFLYLFEHMEWNENEIIETLKNEYNWQEDKAYGRNQWRMGDGQTAFTNYIFRQLVGFTEFDDFRSTQIRKGKITRDEALYLVEKDNEPKYEVLEKFASTVGLNLESVLSKIDVIKKNI